MRIAFAAARDSHMPFSDTIDSAANLIREIWTGRVTVQDLRQSSLEEWANPRYRAGISILSDFREAELEISYPEMTG